MTQYDDLARSWRGHINLSYWLEMGRIPKVPSSFNVKGEFTKGILDLIRIDVWGPMSTWACGGFTAFNLYKWSIMILFCALNET